MDSVILGNRSEEHTSELQSQSNLVCRLLLETKHTESTPVQPHAGARQGRPPGGESEPRALAHVMGGVRAFTRSYNSKRAARGRTGAFGPGWTHSFDNYTTLFRS